MLTRSGFGGYAAVMLAVGVTAGAAFVGLIGEPRRPERFDAKTVVVEPAGADGLRVTEYVDVDFGGAERRGYQRLIPLDLGVPTDIEAFSATAPDDVGTEMVDGELRIRVGDPDVTVSGRHRYVLGYTYPEAGISAGRLSLDIIGTDEEFETDRFEVVVAGLDLEGVVCSTGTAGTEGGCSLERSGDVYRTVIAPLEPGEGITVSGDVVGRLPDVLIDAPAPPEPRAESGNRGLVAGAVAAMGAAAAAAVRRYFGRWGRNEVYGGGAADAAFGTQLTAPPGSSTEAVDRPDVRMVSDAHLGELATTEFVPPEGLEPWEANVLMRERIDDTSISAWFSGLAGHGVLALEERDKSLVIRPGPERERATGTTSALVDRLFAGGDEVVLKGYDKDFASLWSSVRGAQAERIGESGWWVRRGPSSGGGLVDPVLMLMLAGLGVAGALGFAGFTGALSNAVLAALGSALLVAGVAVAVWAPLLRARSAVGSALTLRAESFRRFLEASEGRHVQWAWERGLVREYSGWAVALGAADAWQRALAAADTTIERSASTPLLMATGARYVASAHTAPSSSGGGGGSSVGGGGGGGSSGSW